MPRSTSAAARSARSPPRRRRAPSTRRAPSSPAKLREYNRKRDFSLTSEPRGTASSPRAAIKSGRSFVIQQHNATRMHYDFRLEHGGVLWSWAVPKGPSLDPADKRLAVQTEDHPIRYRDFEGHIPEGEYGGGPVIVWDRGTWEPEGDADQGMRKGHLVFKLDGEKLQGRFQLVRLRGKVASGPKSNWLLIKRSDAHVRTGEAAKIVEQRPESVISGKTIGGEVVAKSKKSKRAPNSKPATAKAPAPAAVKSPKKSRLPDLKTIEPQLATLVDRPPPATVDWLYEVKFDGYRMLAARDGNTVSLRSRNGLDWSQALSPLGDALRKLKGVSRTAVFDGELCFVEPDGRTSFQKLQNHMPRGKATGMSPHLVFFVFDLLFCDGEDLRGLPLRERKQRLRQVLGAKPKWPLAYSDHIEQDDGRTAFLQACRAGLEGLIAKRADAPYREGRGRDWLKLKCQKRQEFVIVGMIRPSNQARTGFRSLVIATRDGARLTYAGRVGTGFSQESLRDLSKRLSALVVERSPLVDPPRLGNVAWVQPELVCEVEYTEVTQDGSLRHPSFQGLREDKPASQVRREKALPVEEAVPASRSAAASPRNQKGAGQKPSQRKPSRRAGTARDDDDDENSVLGIHVSNPDRVVDATSGLTKLELVRYHERVGAQWLLPYARRRPLALVRCPAGSAQQCFFQKHVMPGIGADVIKGRAGKQEVLYVEKPEGLVELAQFNVVELHGWGSTMDDPSRPDWFVIDLDPDAPLPFARVIDAAFEVREALDSIGLKSWVKTTGGKGLHVCVPLKPKAGWDQVKAFTHAIAKSLEARAPDRYVSTLTKAKRVGKIFIDYLRNGQGATAILPYSPRARPGATVAMPLDWKQLKSIDDPRQFTVRSVEAWLGKRRKDPWADFLASPQALPQI